MKKTTTIRMRIAKVWKTFGPGMITGASDDDPSGIATYSQAGAAFGLSTLWTALITFPLMASIQEMCARIGVVTSKGLCGVLRE
ncbi:MAG TPA: divalent metal cation transporter, partial [Puia sp.]|nr:divalent metal cation transporter [Puia sp.]